jgi:diketogulonate reductase-like aldo/keto reductase
MISIWLSNGRQMPRLGLGTWQLRGSTCERVVRTALELGYRHIDTAEMYENEREVGSALATSGVDRGELFVTTKVWSTHFRAADLRKAAEGSLRRLRTDYVDLLLLHWPSESVPLAETLGALCDVSDEGKARAIGVSNFSVSLLQRAIGLSRVAIACNQVEYHVLSPRKALLDYARANGIAVTAYSPLARGRLTRHPVLTRIGAKYGKSASQVALRWLLEQEGVAAIPKASGEPNLRANLEIFDFSLDADDRAELDSLAR